jgi:predicted transcriptional regulator of viral defense system
MDTLSDNKSKDILKGTTLQVYRLMLKARKPIGVREVQRALHLSSSSVAMYHVSKLEDAGLLRYENGQYVINEVLFDNIIVFHHFLIPKTFFYSMFALVAAILELSFFKPLILVPEYFFSTIVTYLLALIFLYEALKTWLESK